MANYARTNTSALVWTNTAAWTPTGAPTTTADAAQFTSTITAANSTTAATVTVGQIEIVAPGGLITILPATSQVITLNPSASFSNVGIKFTGTAGNTLTVTAAIALGSDQTWDFGTSNKTLTVSSANNVLQNAAGGGTYSLTLTGLGRFASAFANTFGGVGKTITLQNGVYCTPGNAGTLGDANNTVYVGPNATLDLTLRTLNQTNYYATGAGTLGYSTTIAANQVYGAVNIGSFADGKNVFATGTSATFTLNNAANAVKLTGSVTDYIEIDAVTSTISALTNTANDFYAPGGVRISSLSILSPQSSLNRAYNVGATDAAAGTNESAPFGDSRNVIRVLPSGKLYSAPAAGVTRTVARTISFDGDAANTHIQNSGSAGSVLAFSGALTFSGNATNGTEVSSIATTGGVAFTGTIAGPGALRCVTAGSTVTFDSTATNAFSSWAGELQTPSTVYPVYKNGYATLTNKRVATGVSAYFINGLNTDITLAHSSYTIDDDAIARGSFSNTTINLGPGAVTGTAATNYFIESASAANTTLVVPGNLTGQLYFGTTGDSSTGTVVVSGTNTRSGTGAQVGWGGVGSLCLNSSRALGNGATTADNFAITATGKLDNTSGAPVTLAHGAAKQLNANFSWVGTNDLDLGPGTTTWNGPRIITFAAGGGTKTLTVPAATTTTATATWNVGGGTAGAKQRLALNGANASLATTGSVTAGYFRVNNAAGLGAVGTTTSWAVSSGAALELDGGITVPGTKNGTFIGNGPNTDGALRSTTSGTNKWQGAIQFTNAAGGRIKATDGTTLTLDPTGSPAYTGIDGTSSCPVYFDAGISATLNQDRILANTVGIVYCGNNGSSSGRVVLSKANQHTGALNCESGTTALTNQNAAGPAATGAGVNVKQSARLAVEIASTYKAVFPGTTALGVGATSYAARAYFRIGA